jgi:hypothetical protein
LVAAVPVVLEAAAQTGVTLSLLAVPQLQQLAVAKPTLILLVPLAVLAVGAAEAQIQLVEQERLGRVILEVQVVLELTAAAVAVAQVQLV